MNRLMVVLGIAASLSACGGSSGGDNPTPGRPTPVPTQAPIPYEQLKAPEPSSEVLQTATEEQLVALLKNGVRRDVLYARNLNTFAEGGLFETALDSAANAPVPEASPAPARADFSTTNTQVFGVDEADHVKYDGERLYVHAYPKWQSDSYSADRIRILDTHPETATATPVSEIVLDENSYSNLQMYLLDGTTDGSGADAVVTLKSDGFIGWCGVGAPEWGWYNRANEITVQLHAMEDPAAPELDWQLELDGMLHHSRKIGDMLYLVTSFVPQMPLFEDTENGDVPEALEGDADVSVSATEHALADLQVEELLPGYRINGGERQLLHTSEECLVSASLDEYHGYRSLHHITAIDLRNQQVAESVCMSTPVENIYSSTDSLYLVATEYATNWTDSYSVLHKFSLADNDVTYVATGSVPGNLGWSSPSFRMDEHDGYMRLITSSFSDNGNPDHRLWVLEENNEDKTLDLVSMLPEQGSTASIGKPGEDIYAVRFWGDKAYVVTFERIDPLYILDLANPAAPTIAGELELPGFSTYLHPLDEGYVFGFGQDANDAGVVQGLKAALFDVRDPADPKIAGEITLGGRWSWSDALYDHKSLSFLRNSEDQLRITLPATLSSGGSLLDNSLELMPSPEQRLLVLMEVNGLSEDDASLRLHGAMQTGVVSDTPWYDYSAFGRGVLHGDAIYYVDEPHVWGAFWSTPETVYGPFEEEPVELDNPIHVGKSRGGVQCESAGLTPTQSQSVLLAADVAVVSASCGEQYGLAFPAVCGGGNGEWVIHQIEAVDLGKAEAEGYTQVVVSNTPEEGDISPSVCTVITE